jgi:small GTP-binding protein
MASKEASQPAGGSEQGKFPPGFNLRHRLYGHTGTISRMAWSPDGRTLASGSNDHTIRLWDIETASVTPSRVLAGHSGWVYHVAWSPDGRILASSSGDKTIRLWDPASGSYLRTLEGHADRVFSLAWSPDGQILASGSGDNTIRLWDAHTGQVLQTLYGHGAGINELAWFQDKRLASGSYDKSIRLWEPSWDGKTSELTQILQGHTAYITSVAWSPDGRALASCAEDKSIRLWDPETGRQTMILEGHTEAVTCVSFSFDGQLLASKSRDGTVRLWRAPSWDQLIALPEPASDWWPISVRFHPTRPVLATLGEDDRVIRIWGLDLDRLLSGQTAGETTRYTTAKLVLVGDSGVGKTGLGWRLAHGEFKEHTSTHGQQFWAIPQLGLTRTDGTECEAVLWDLAGQHVYRPIHAIFLDNVAAALVLFDPSNRQDPLKGVQFWLEQLKGKGPLPPALLVGARVDRGAPALSHQDLDQFCQRYGIRGGYISTSALKGEGLDTLLDTLKAQIPWEAMTATVTTVTFKRIKDYVLALKEQPDRQGVLVSPSALCEHLQATDPDWRFTDAEMMTAVGHLDTHGYVAVLRSSAGEQYILLTPDLLVTLASSIVLLADKHPRELGAVNETELLQGTYPFDELAGLPPTERQIVLDAAVRRFVEHNLCFRVTLHDETLLIFPGLIKQKRPLQDDLPATDDISYVVRGRVENLYASLVVLLGYTPSFSRINQWQHQAQYEMGEGEICGFRLIEDREGEIELVLYFGDRLPLGGRVKFQELFEEFLYQRDVEVTRFPPVVCPKGHRLERATVIKRVREGKRFVFCEECGDRTDLPDLDKLQTIGVGASPWLQREGAAARLRSAYEVHLTKVKGYRRGWATPRCYVSHLPEQAAWAEKLVLNLRDAGVYVVEQAALVQPDDFVVVLDTPAYQRAFDTPLLAADAPLIRARLDQRGRLLSLALTGQADAHAFNDCTLGSFCDETHYPVSLFDLVLNLYAIPLTHAGFAPLRQALHEQWEHTLARTKGDHVTSPLKIFISYSHKDEPFKEELITMLAGLQRRGIVDAWHDRRIDAGDEWHTSIQDAMHECDLALLLVSADYLASRFIQEEEQPKLLQGRQDMQLRVIPIIVRPCPWQSEPVLKGLQALPRDNKAVITFLKEDGARDQVWTDIAIVIEERAKMKPTP